MHVGHDFWQGFWNDDEPCDMLGFKDGIAYCKVYKSRPDVCRNYPFKEDDYICMGKAGE